jgi:hypothetical protein
MESNKDQKKQENQNQPLNFFPLNMPGSLGITQNPISYLTNPNSEFLQDEQTKNNLFIQKRNRMEDTNGKKVDKLEINVDSINKGGENNDTSSDINMKSPHPQKSKLYQMNQLNNHDQFICKKMSIDLDDDITNPNIIKKNNMGCNCKNSGCLKRYCECFSRMKYCDINCQCNNCYNNVKHEKERNDAIKIYLVKSPVSFKKINMDLNNITCNCKKSNCLKNYCECFQFGLKCTYSCGCVDCKNRNLFEKKLFFVENNCEKKNTNQNINSNNIQKNSISSNNNNNLIKLQEEESNINNVNNNKSNINNNNIDKLDNNKKNINNPQFIVNKNVNNNILNNNNISPSKIKSRTRYMSFDDDISQLSQWNNLNLKKIEISNKKLIIDNYNVNQPDEMDISSNTFQSNNYSNYYNNFKNNNVNSNNNNNNIIITRKNSAFSAIIK